MAHIVTDRPLSQQEFFKLIARYTDKWRSAIEVAFSQDVTPHFTMYILGTGTGARMNEYTFGGDDMSVKTIKECIDLTPPDTFVACVVIIEPFMAQGKKYVRLVAKDFKAGMSSDALEVYENVDGKPVRARVTADDAMIAESQIKGLILHVKERLESKGSSALKEMEDASNTVREAVEAIHSHYVKCMSDFGTAALKTSTEQAVPFSFFIYDMKNQIPEPYDFTMQAGEEKEELVVRALKEVRERGIAPAIILTIFSFQVTESAENFIAVATGDIAKNTLKVGLIPFSHPDKVIDALGAKSNISPAMLKEIIADLVNMQDKMMRITLTEIMTA